MDIIFGALAAPLWQQLKISNGHPKMAAIQDQADAITLLCIHGILSEAERHRARRRLLKQIRALMKSLT